MVDALAAVVSAIAIVAGAIFVVVELRQAATDRYLQVSSHLFQLWQSADFQEDQLYLLHHMAATDWEGFIKLGRASRAERAFHRVGGFYDRLGHLVLSGLIKQDDVLPTIGGDAVAVWGKIEPLVREARRKETPFLFKNYEAVLPKCVECYYGVPQPVTTGTERTEDEVPRIEPRQLFELLQGRGAIVLDVSKGENPHRIKGALRATPNELSGWLQLVQGIGRRVVTYCT